MEKQNDFKQWLTSELERIDKYRTQLRTALHVHDLYEGGDTAPAPEDTPADWIGLQELDIDLSGAANLTDRLIIIAKATGRIHTVETAHYLVQMGYSSGQPKNIRGHIHNILAEHEDFVKIAPNLFDYQPYTANPVTLIGCVPPLTTLQ